MFWVAGEVVKARYRKYLVRVGKRGDERRVVGYAAKVGGGRVVYSREEYLRLAARAIAELEYGKLSEKALVQLKHFIAEVVRQKTGRELEGWRQKSVEELMEEAFRALDMSVGGLVEKEDSVDGTKYVVWVEGKKEKW